MKKWRDVTREHVLEAIRKFDQLPGKFPPARSTFLCHEGKQYPAKHIRWLAYEVANGTPMSKEEFSGGEETTRFFRNLGFKVEYSPKKRLGSPASVRQEPSMPAHRVNVVSQKNALQRLLQKEFGILETEKTFPWMRTPSTSQLPAQYRPIAKALKEYRGHDAFLAPGRSLQCDMVLDEHRLIIEYDEKQHFSKARLLSLLNYPSDIYLNYSTEHWIRECRRVDAHDNDPPDRDEKRAYYDTTRDIEAARNGYTLVRICHGVHDWTSPEAAEYLRSILPVKSSSPDEVAGKHVIGRIVLACNPDNGAKSKELVRIMADAPKRLHPVTHVQFLVTPAKFLTFDWPPQLQERVEEEEWDRALEILESAAGATIMKFLAQLSPQEYRDLARCVDYLSIGIDGENCLPDHPMPQHVELVALVDLSERKIVHWTGKSQPTNRQKNALIRFRDLNTHFHIVEGLRVISLGCHDLNLFSPRSAATAKGWKLANIHEFQGKAKRFGAQVILHHPHGTDTPNIWRLGWKTAEKILPTVKHYASGIKYFRPRGERASLEDVLAATKKGDVVDLVFK